MKRYSLFLISLILLMTTGCNQRKEVAENPFFEEWETPYGVPPFDRIRPEHFLPAFQRAMSIQEADISIVIASYQRHNDPFLFLTLETVNCTYAHTCW